MAIDLKVIADGEDLAGKEADDVDAALLVERRAKDELIRALLAWNAELVLRIHQRDATILALRAKGRANGGNGA
jgi:hypothetical protein